MRTFTEDELAKLKGEHPNDTLHLLSNEEVDMQVVVKTPSDGDWRRFRTMQADEAQRPGALRTLLLGCMVQPPAAEFMGVLAQRPGLAETFGGEVVTIAGVSRATTSRKL